MTITKGIPMKTKLRKPIKWHGGKDYLADWIIGHMPPRAKNPNAPAADDPGWCHYVEPYYGGGAVQMALDPDGISEVVNDMNRDLINFFDVVRDEKLFPQFQRQVVGTPCAQDEFRNAVAMLKLGSDPVKRAVAFFVVNRQSRQALGKDFATLARTRTRSGMNELPSAWLSAIDGLPEVHARMKRVVILNDPAVKVIRQQDGPRTLYYLDPPYFPDTRAVPDAYLHEMSERAHAILLATISKKVVVFTREQFDELDGEEHWDLFAQANAYEFQGRFLLSGYSCALYERFAMQNGWRRVEIQIDNKSSGAKKKEKKTEVLWMNY